MKPNRLSRRWLRRHRKLLDSLARLLQECRRRGAPESVHELRVTLRRLRLSVRLGRLGFDEAVLGRWRAWARRVSRATSPVRDLDIAVEWLQAVKASPALLQECKRRRDRLWRRRRKQIPPVPPRLLSALAQPDLEQAASRSLERRFKKLEGRYRDWLRRQVPRFFRLGEEERHDVRRTVRWWRYLRELAVAGKKLPRDPATRLLLPAQEALGELQNLALVQAALQNLTPGPERAELLACLARQLAAHSRAAQSALRDLRRKLAHD